MRLLMSGLTLFVALCLLAPAGDRARPKPPIFTGAHPSSSGTGPATDHAATASLQSAAPYVDGGQRGLEVRVWINGSQDLTIGTFAVAEPSASRTLRPVMCHSPPRPHRDRWSDNAFVNVRNIAAMAVGTTKITRASFNTAVGHFRWLGAPNPDTGATNDPSYGSQAVVVTRADAATPGTSTRRSRCAMVLATEPRPGELHRWRLECPAEGSQGQADAGGAVPHAVWPDGDVSAQRLPVSRVSTSGTLRRARRRDPPLTERERRLVRILASGATNREIAARMGLREQTVKNRLSAIYGKLGLRNRLELAVHLARIAASAATPRDVLSVARVNPVGRATTRRFLGSCTVRKSHTGGR